MRTAMCDVWCGAVCLGTDYGINHGHQEQPWERYEMYRKMYANCTYVDGNLEILFLDGEHNYNMSFLKVFTARHIFHHFSTDSYIH